MTSHKHLRVRKETHKKVKIRAALNDKKIADYIHDVVIEEEKRK